MELDAALRAVPTGDRRRFDRDAGVLVGTRCADCGGVAWPGRAVCHRCGSPSVVEQAFGGAGRLESYTEVMVPRPGLENPYVLGQIRLQDGPVVFGRVVGLVEPVDLPCTVRTRIGPGPDGAVSYWFEKG